MKKLSSNPSRGEVKRFIRYYGTKTYEKKRLATIDGMKAWGCGPKLTVDDVSRAIDMWAHMVYRTVRQVEIFNLPPFPRGHRIHGGTYGGRGRICL